VKIAREAVKELKEEMFSINKKKEVFYNEDTGNMRTPDQD
jgi:hypothetical protein